MFPNQLSQRLFTLSIISSIAIVSMHAAPSRCPLCNDGMSAIGKDNYITETLVHLTENPLEMALSRKSGNIYYINYNDDVEKVLNVFVKAENKHMTIPMNETVQTMALDNNARKLYLGFKSGLKVYDECSKVTTNISSITHNISKLAVTENGQIYALLASQEVYTYGQVSRYNYNTLQPRRKLKVCPDKKILDFVVKSDDEIYVRTLDIQYNIILKDIKQGYCEKYYSGDIVFSNLARDNFGRVYGVSSNAIYRLHSNQTEPKMLIELNDVSIGSAAPSFDASNNIVLVNIKNNVKVLVVKPKMYTQQ